MKMIFAFLSLSLALSAFADAGNAKSKTIRFVEDHLNKDAETGDLTGKLTGKTNKNQDCALHLSNINGAYRIVVAPLDVKNQNEYIGVNIEGSNISTPAGSLDLLSYASWGNDSSLNHVTIDFNNKGEPSVVTGQSDIEFITCYLDKK